MLASEIFKRFGGGSSGSSIVLQDASVVGTKYAQWTIGFDGFTYERHTSGAAVQDLPWISPQQGMGNYQVKATVSSGDVPPGNIGVWQTLSASYTWGFVNSSSEASCDLLIEIRRASDSVVVGSATVSLFVAGIQ